MDIDTETQKIIADPMKRKAWVRYQLELKGLSLASLAKRWGNTRQQPQRALYSPYPLWEKRLAEELGLTPQQLFPERYDADGLPIRMTGGLLCNRCHVTLRNSTTESVDNNTQNVAQS